MLLSIIIPVYNVEPYLRECLDSVFSQDLTDCEVIAVNDGSTDGSRSILEEYKVNHSEFFSVIDKTNGGQSSARNLGVNYAMGDYFYFMDSDDYLKPNAIGSIRQAVDASEGADVIYLDCIVDDRGQRLGKHKVKNVPRMDFRSFFQFAYDNKMVVAPNPVSYVYSSGYWREAGLHYEEGVKYEDALFAYQLFVRIDGTIKVVHIEEPFYVYRVGREGSTTTNITLKNFADKQYIRKTTDRLWKEQGVGGVAYYHTLFKSCVFMLYEAYKSDLISQHGKFWDSDDVRIMRKGVSDEREYGLWLLAKISPRWMARYYANDLPSWKRRVTNVMLSGTRPLFKKR